MRMIVTALKVRVYGKVLSAGDEFECPDKEARLWGALARAKPSDEAGKSPRQLSLAGETASDQASQGRRQGRYGRRDMRAEG